MQSVTVHVKAILVGMLEHVQIEDSWQGLTKLVHVVGGATGTVRIVLSEKKLAVHSKVILQMCMSKTSKGRTTFQCLRKGTIVHIDDIDDVAEME